MIKKEFKRILNTIKKYDTIVIARHISPDPDAISSEISLRELIKLNFPKKTVFAVGTSVSKFKYYGNLDKIDDSKLKEDALLICTDVPNQSRVDGVDFANYKEVFKIDHHPSDEVFGESDYIDETATSTCEIIAELVLDTNLKITKEIARNLYLGIVSDSERFLIKYTTARTFDIVSRLIKKTDIDFTSDYHYLYERPIEEIRFKGYLEQNLKVTDNGLGYLELFPDIFKEYKVDSSTPSNMINDFNNIKGVYVWVFINHDDKNDLVKINIRSNGPVINEIAANYGGGGHKYASGIRSKDESIIPNLINDLDNACKEYKENLQ
jgi:phosphoesterase RecJ-like protein